MRDKYQIVVVGGGVAGAGAALALARSGWTLALIDAGRPSAPAADESPRIRVSTLNPASTAILRALGVWTEAVSARACPFDQMRVWEGEPNRELCFSAADADLRHLGHVVENDSIQAALWRALEQEPLVRVYPEATVHDAHEGERGVRLDLDQGGVAAELLIAADGAGSPLRERFGFRVREWDYQQCALVGPVTVAAGHQNTAWQRFLDRGPLAFLPLSDGGCSIVWTLPGERAAELAAAPDEELAAALTEASQERLGAVACAGTRATFALRRVRAERYVQSRVVLLGDAAHVVHPLAGQGANLGLLDAAALAEALEPVHGRGTSPADPVALRSFERWRKSENEIMATTLHALRALYRIDAPPIAFGRRLGVDLLNRSRPLRARLIAHASGYGGRVPRLARPKPGFGDAPVANSDAKL